MSSSSALLSPKSDDASDEDIDNIHATAAGGAGAGGDRGGDRGKPGEKTKGGAPAMKKRVSERTQSVRYNSNARTREEMSGWLFKRGKKLGLKEKRFFKMSGTVLSNYRDPSEEPTWTVNLLNCEVLPGNQKEEVIIKLREKTIRLQAKTAEETSKWVDVFKKASSMTLENFYDVEEVLGVGEFGVVRKGCDKATKVSVAIKSIRKKDYKEEEYYILQREVEIMLNLTHPNIVKTLDVFETETKLHIVMEHMTGGMLYDVLSEQESGFISEKTAADLMFDIFQAVDYLHEQGIVHRDIKPENILVSSTRMPLKCKLSDFGLANFIDKGSAVLHTQVGTPAFAAPEVVRLDSYGRPVDLWSIGVLMYNLLSGSLPFNVDDTAEAMFTQILACKYDFPPAQWSVVSDSAIDLIQNLLVLEPEKRLSASQALKHRWFKQGAAGNAVRLSYHPSSLHSNMKAAVKGGP